MAGRPGSALLGLMFLSIIIFCILFLITSQSFLKLIFSIQESVGELEVVFQSFLKLIFSISPNVWQSQSRHVNVKNSNKFMSYSNLTYRTMSTWAGPTGKSSPSTNVSNVGKKGGVNQIFIKTGGYKGYLDSIITLGCLDELLDKIYLILKLKELLIESLLDDVGYSVLLNIKYTGSNYEITGTSPLNSIYITKKTNLELMSDTLLHSLYNAQREYNLSGLAIVEVICREWLSQDEFIRIQEKNKNEIFKRQRREVLEQEIENNIKGKLGGIHKFIDLSKLEFYLSKYPDFNCYSRYKSYKEVSAELDSLS